MEIKNYLHMNVGNGELSYSQNSSVQARVWLMNQSLLENAIQSLITSKDSGLNIADLGCGVGNVPLGLVSFLVEIMQKKSKELLKLDNNDDQVPQLQIYMNDLPSNDFNSLFKEMMNLDVLKKKDDDGVPLCFLMGAPGSYYDRLFPNKSLHLVHANYSLHWLSKVPPRIYDDQRMSINKGNIYISETSPAKVGRIYRDQFEQDFTLFLKSRSKEVIANGCMLLTLRGRPSSTNPLTWTTFEFKIFTKTLASLVSEGLIKEEKLDTFDFPCYCATKEQLESIAKKEGSFEVETSKTMVVDVAPEIEDKWERAQVITKIIRAFSESLVSSHFGEDISTLLYDKLVHFANQHLVDDQLAQNHAVTVLLRKK
ncbi:hypothetical protein SOVF_048010 [Spinacia oleracea]|nr:hypothetical protein SOVF_048010 [Spinacia oleracea]